MPTVHVKLCGNILVDSSRSLVDSTINQEIFVYENIHVLNIRVN